MKTLLLFVFVSCFGYIDCGCSNSNWWASFNHEGLSTCSNQHNGIRGFYRIDRKNTDYIYLLEEAVCCSQSRPYSKSTGNYVYANWWITFDSGNAWANCPSGYFLQGLWRTGGKNAKLWNIEEGRCWKPADHPYHYGHCYKQDITSSFNNRGTSQCKNNYFVTGLYRSYCDQLHCLDALRCCKMAPKPDKLNSLSRVKTLVMDRTLTKMAQLAHYLGYGWCGGCRGEWVGDDFRRNGDTWEADKSKRCDGYKSDHRLSINYAHWSFAVKDIKYGKPLITDLQPETIDSGVVRNNSPSKTTRTISRTEEVARTVTHTTTSSWKVSTELGIQISYTPSLVSSLTGFSFTSSFKFGYEKSSTTTDSKGKVQKKIISVSDSTELKPYSAVKFDLVISKTRTTLPYTATIIAQFSAEFRGFLRWGRGRDRIETNYHYQHHGSHARPTFDYRFGDAKTPFYEALKYQSDTMQRPWEWGSLKANYGSAQSIIDSLTNERQYEFTLTGKFDDVTGKRIDVTWSKVPVKRDASLPTYDTEIVDLGNHEMVAKEMPGDPEPLFPPPPKVDIQLPDNGEELEILESTEFEA